jgi:hypothetical protein
MLPNFVIIGAQKSAITFLHWVLRLHPDVFMPEMEIPFLESPDYENHGMERLESIFSGKDEKLLGIKRPNYIADEAVALRIKKHLPEAKLIAILRNPVERMVSAYYHYMNTGFIPVSNIETGMSHLLNGDYGHKYKRAKEIIEFGFYFRHLQRYKSYFDSNNFLVLLHEDFIQDKIGSIKKAYRFLELDESFIPEDLNAEPQKVMYSIPRLKIRSLFNPVIYRYFNDNTRLEPRGTRLAAYAEKLKNLVDNRMMSLVWDSKKPVLSGELKKSLYALYSDDIHHLEKFLARDLSTWKSG